MTTKLSKQAFYDELARLLIADGWTRLPDASGLTSLFAKRVGDLVLSLGTSESSRYRERVTADFRLARHTFMTLGSPDAPRTRARVGRFLDAREREELLDAEYCRPGVLDAWWIARTREAAEAIAAAVRCAEPRFLGQVGLADEVEQSTTHAEYVAKLSSIASTPFEEGRTTNGPPAEWVDAAYDLVPAANPKHRRAFAANIAADAWRTYRLLR